MSTSGTRTFQNPGTVLLIVAIAIGFGIELATSSIVLAIGLGISFLPDVSMAGHIGGIIGGVLTAVLLKLPRNES